MATALGNAGQIFRAHRHADQQLFVTEIVAYVLRRIPGGTVGPLHVVEHDGQRRARARFAKVFGDFRQQRILAAGN